MWLIIKLSTSKAAGLYRFPELELEPNFVPRTRTITFIKSIVLGTYAKKPIIRSCGAAASASSIVVYTNNNINILCMHVCVWYLYVCEVAPCHSWIVPSKLQVEVSNRYIIVSLFPELVSLFIYYFCFILSVLFLNRFVQRRQTWSDKTGLGTIANKVDGRRLEYYYILYIYIYCIWLLRIRFDSIFWD